MFQVPSSELMSKMKVQDQSLRSMFKINVRETDRMKLATYSTANDATLKVGLVRGEEIVPLADNGISGDMISLLDGGLDNDAIASATHAKQGIPLSSVSLHAPIPLPGKILAIGLNYGDHIAECGLTNNATAQQGPTPILICRWYLTNLIMKQSFV